MVDAAEHDAKMAAQRLGKLLEQSERSLYPGVGDPLSTTLDVSSHRWLAGHREESYSDWLAWILERQDDASLVLPLFGFDARSDVQDEWAVDREVVTPYGRLDLLLRNPQLGVLCVEVKTESVPERTNWNGTGNGWTVSGRPATWFFWRSIGRRMIRSPRNTVSAPGNM